MSKVVDVRKNGGALVIRGKAVVLPTSASDGTALPLDGSTRFNPDTQAAELYSNESWGPIDAPVDNAVAAHQHPLSQITGLQTALGNKSPLVHNHPLSEVSGLQMALSDKAATTHAHAITDITNLRQRLDTIQTGLAGKSAKTHTHGTLAVTGLNDALMVKAPLTHEHSLSQITGAAEGITKTRPRVFHIPFTGDPTLDDRVYFPFVLKTRIPANFKGSTVNTLEWPTSEVRIRITHVGASGSVVLGRIILNPNEPRVTFQLTSSASIGVVLTPGDYLMFDYELGSLTAQTTIALSAERLY